MARKKDLFYSKHWSHFLSLNFLLWPNSRLRTHNQGHLWSSPKAKNQPSITLSIWKIDRYTVIPHNASVPNGAPRERSVSKLGVFITIPPLDTVSIFCMQMAPGQSLSLTPDLPLDLPALDPQVWNTDHPSTAKHHPPVHIILKDLSTIITQQQYSLTPKAHKGLKPIIDCLLQASILIPTNHHTTPLFWQ